MRLLFISFTFPPQANGVAEVVAAQARELAARGHHVTVATGWDEARTIATVDGVHVESFRLTGKADDPAEAQRYRQFIAEFSADVIVCHCWRIWSTDLAAPMLARNPARKILVSHGYSAHRYEPVEKFPWGLGVWWRGLGYIPFSIRILRVFDHVVFLSERQDFDRFADHWFVRWRGRPAASVIPNGTYAERSAVSGAAFRARYGLGPGPLLICLSTYAPSKNQELALRAFLQADCPEANLLFIGQQFNTYSDHLRTLCGNTPGGERVRFLAGLSRPELSEAYAAADLVVLSSRAETQPLVLLDAMAAGRAFISTDVGCVSEMPGGMVVRGERAMTAAMRELIREPTRRTALAAAGQAACAKYYNWPHVADCYEKLFAHLAAEPR